MRELLATLKELDAVVKKRGFAETTLATLGSTLGSEPFSAKKGDRSR
jgi:hypothetical protein